ncbi:TetR family transcriptional regulator [Butyrivibrio sp. YAB3001]|uniref:TetR family transcriptional regulator n=1 Tax=Butyrivibrio sp. YAB3001 TaxID=1520812 RepID=UPI0008F68364|nr:TetR family transcriptional regulator [Butyrivibrio sp. YAB3001]SFC20661.1 transcriptional regulator, TetR family [Butyrivibrio sp. YAB3001]
MKRKTSKEILAESFREVAENKNIDKITVKDITDNCGYSPATFYRLFSDKYDLIAWDYTREVDNILCGVDGTREAWTNTLKSVAMFLEERKKYLANLFLHTSGLEAFSTYMQEANYRCLMDMMQKAEGEHKIDKMTEMCIRLYILGTVQFTSEL